MKYLRFLQDEKEFFGVIKGDKVQKISGDIYGDFEVTGETLDLEGLTLLAPSKPTKVVCVGKNYYDHAKEMNSEVPKEPCLFIKPTTSILDPNGNIIYPEISNRVDYEGELALIIKKKCKNVSESEAMDYVSGYTCLNDVTARDIQASDGQWTRGKGIDTFCPFGPIVTDEINPNNVMIETRLNGVIKQKSNTSNFMFDIATVISFVSKAFTLLPGDVITTGTPAGIGPMNVGDVVEVEIEGIGILKNTLTK